MLKAPKFWYTKKDTYLSNALYPLSLVFRLGTKIRYIISKKKKANLPIICIGNIVVGGAGKTPVALKIGKMLKRVVIILILYLKDMEVLKKITF